MEPNQESAELRTSLLQTSATALKMRQRMEQEVRGANAELEQRTAELAHALAIVRATLAATTDAILVTDNCSRVVEYNRHYAELWRPPTEIPAERSAEKLWEITSHQFAVPERYLARLKEILESTGESMDVLELKEGRIVERYSNALEIDGVPMGRVWGFRDVTDRHVAEIASRHLAAIVASSDDAIVGKDLNSIITSWNDGAVRIFGYSAEEMIGSSIMRLIPPDRQQEEGEILSRIRRGLRIEHFETVRRAKDGHDIDVSVSVSPIKDSTGTVVGASKIARDVTAQREAKRAIKETAERAEALNRGRLQLLEDEREARARAERANRMKDEFLATLSHELRTPLNAVLGWVNILKTEKCTGAELEEGLAIIERNARAQTQIIEDLLDMSRIISGKVRLDAQRMDLPAVLNEAIDTVRATAEVKGVVFQTIIDPFAGAITGDPHRMQQVFWNLLSNAVKFTRKGGNVQVTLQRVHSHIEVTVADTGQGITPEFLPYVFDRFQQADATTTRRHGGLGLGLAIVKQLVELHGGKVTASSEGMGRGATFSIILPLVAIKSEPEFERRHPTAPERKNQATPVVSLDGVTVLVVDDEPDAREFVRRLLNAFGAAVSTAGSVDEALEKIAVSIPDVLICDIGMPDQDGYSLIRQLRAMDDAAARSVPAVALTAYARSEDRTKAIRSGFQNHLAKPVEPPELLAVVASLAGR